MGSEVLGLIAGQGCFPLEIARRAGEQGREVVAIAFPGLTDPAIEALSASVTWLPLGQVGAAVEALRASGAREAVMAGKVSKTALSAPDALELDETAHRLLGALGDRRDASILRIVADHLAAQGIRLCGQTELAPELLAGLGPLGAAKGSAAMEADFRAGWPVARAVAGLDIGQTVVVKDGTVVAVEGLEGTDAALRRGGGLAPGACAIKVARPEQDLRFDLPAIGPDTIAASVEAGIAALAVEADRTVVLDRPAVVALADAHRLPVIGVSAESLREREA